MSTATVVEALRNDSLRTVGGGGTRGLGLPPEVITYIADHVLVAGGVAFLARVTGDQILGWWRNGKQPIEAGAASMGSVPPPEAVTELLAAVRRLQESLDNVGSMNLPPDIGEAVRQEILAALSAYKINGKPLALGEQSEIAAEMSERIVERLGGRTKS
jgi:hypothetical protein